MGDQDQSNNSILNELRKLGAILKEDDGDRTDFLLRFRKVPLHAMFLYTTEDKVVGEYILKNWGALDSLSGDSCDIHPTLDQFKSQEDAYDFIEGFDVIQKSNFKEYSKLPGMFFWSLNGEYEYISFGPNVTEEKIKTVLRCLFEYVKPSPTISAVKKAKIALNNEREVGEVTWGKWLTAAKTNLANINTTNLVITR